MTPDNTSYCKYCKKILPIEKFVIIYVPSYNIHTPRSNCKDCEIKKSFKSRIMTQSINHRVKIKTVKIMGGKCVCCGVTEWWNLVLDHIKSIKKSKAIREASVTLMRKIINNYDFRKDYQLLCWGCNMNKMTGDKCIIDHNSK